MVNRWISIRGAAVLSKAAQEVANDEREELNAINDQIKFVVDISNEQMEASQERWHDSLQSLETIRKDIYDYQMKEFADILSKIRNLDECPTIGEDFNLQTLYQSISNLYENKG